MGSYLPSNMKISELLTLQTIQPSLYAENKEDALEKMIGLFKPLLGKNEFESVNKAIMERESVMSTGVGKGIALPHGKTSEIEENLAALAVLKTPVVYDHSDYPPVDLIFMLAGSGLNSSEHIRLLSRISTLLNRDEFTSRIRSCKTAEEILDVFRKEEL